MGIPEKLEEVKALVATGAFFPFQGEGISPRANFFLANESYISDSMGMTDNDQCEFHAILDIDTLAPFMRIRPVWMESVAPHPDAVHSHGKFKGYGVEVLSLKPRSGFGKTGYVLMVSEAHFSTELCGSCDKKHPCVKGKPRKLTCELCLDLMTTMLRAKEEFEAKKAHLLAEYGSIADNGLRAFNHA